MHRAGQCFRMQSLESGGLVEADPALPINGDHAIKGQHVVMVVRIQRTPEALGEGNGTELGVANRSRRIRARVTQCGSECPQEDGAGGGASGAVQASTASLRLLSSASTGGLANILVAMAELGLALVMTLAALLLPAMAVGGVLLLVLMTAVSVLRRRRRRSTAA